MTSDDRDEIKRHFDVVAEGLRSEIRLVAEGVQTNTDWLDRVEGELRTVRGEVHAVQDGLRAVQGELHAFRDETREGFGELRSQIRLSYSELERRLTVLEHGQGILESRIQRLEAKLAS
jgi:hypothetical protein